VLPGESLFLPAPQKSLGPRCDLNVNNNNTKLGPVFTENHLYGRSNYDQVTRTIPESLECIVQGCFKIWMRQEGIEATTIRTSEQEFLSRIKLTITRFLSYLTYLGGTFGDVPYAEALDMTIFCLIYEAEKTVYKDLIRSLDSAIMLDESNEICSCRRMYGANVVQWKKFAASLKN